VRLHTFIAHAGIASRRAAESLIREGRVTVNGRVVREMGVVIDPDRDAVKCDGKLVRRPAGRRYFVLNKPKGVLSTLSDPEGRPTVKDFLPPGKGRLYPVGRLDWDAEGILLITDDGSLGNRLAHPRYGAERTYQVKVRSVIDEKTLTRLRRGVRLEDGEVRPERVRILRSSRTSTWLTVTLREGRHHEVKRLFGALGHPVQKLKRVSFAGLTLGTLQPGRTRRLTGPEVDQLRRIGQG